MKNKELLEYITVILVSLLNMRRVGTPGSEIVIFMALQKGTKITGSDYATVITVLLQKKWINITDGGVIRLTEEGLHKAEGMDAKLPPDSTVTATLN